MEDKDKAEHYLLTTRQAAKFLGIGEVLVRTLMARKHNPLPYLNIPNCAYPYFTKEMLIKYFNSFSTEAMKGKNRD